jgi:hypothetical protein
LGSQIEIENPKQIFLKNNFPFHIMDQKIAEVKKGILGHLTINSAERKIE